MRASLSLYSLGTGHKQPNICTVWVRIAHPHFLNCIFAFSRFIISKPLEQLVVSGRKTWHEIVHVQISLLIVPSLCASATLRNGIVDSQGMHGHFYREKLWNSKTSLCFFHPDNLFLSVNQKSPDVFVSSSYHRSHSLNCGHFHMADCTDSKWLINPIMRQKDSIYFHLLIEFSQSSCYCDIIWCFWTFPRITSIVFCNHRTFFWVIFSS